MLLKHITKIRSIVFDQKSEQNEDGAVNLAKTATYVPVDPIPKRKDVSKRLCSTAASSTIGNGCEQQVIVLVCDDDGKWSNFGCIHLTKDYSLTKIDALLKQMKEI